MHRFGLLSALVTAGCGGLSNFGESATSSSHDRRFAANTVSGSVRDERLSVPNFDKAYPLADDDGIPDDDDLRQFLDCSVMKGDLIVGGEVSHLDSFSYLTEIKENHCNSHGTLSDLFGLNRSAKVDCNLVVMGCDLFRNSTSLEPFTEVEGVIKIATNGGLNDLFGLGHSIIIGAELTTGPLYGELPTDRLLTIISNPSLPYCETEWFVRYLNTENQSASALIYENVVDECQESSRVCPPSPT